MTQFELHLLESGISGDFSIALSDCDCLEFELHLLESGISGIWYTLYVPCYRLFELHLLESGISGGFIDLSQFDHFLFELHLLESGISGDRDSKRYGLPHLRLNSTYWNLVFQDSPPSWWVLLMLCLNSTYWNLVFQAYAARAIALSMSVFELHLLESGISGNIGGI